MTESAKLTTLLNREQVAANTRHWVRLGTACNSRCSFCLDGDQGRAMLRSMEEIVDDLSQGRRAHAQRVILSGGEASIHPQFVNVISRSKAMGYTWVQTISNGIRFADKDFLTASMNAGLDEVTFSIHGHTAQLHDHLTGKKGAFKSIVTAIARAVRSGKLVVSVDILLCRENISVLDRIVELCISLGVREYDLLHVIPQGRAFDNRDQLFYEPGNHIDTLHRVLQLSRHPEITIWTNRLPARYLEGFEELIQDPHKLYDEVRGREQDFRNWFDTGTPLPCRQPERCQSCFIEGFCSYVDDIIHRLHDRRWEIFDVGAEMSWAASRNIELPFGCHILAFDTERPGDYWKDSPEGVTGLILRVQQPFDPRPHGEPELPIRLVLCSSSQLDAAMLGGALPHGVSLDIELNSETALWLLEHRAEVDFHRQEIVLNQSGVEQLGASPMPSANLRKLFGELGNPLSVRGLPLCLLSGAESVTDAPTLDFDWFDHASGKLLPQRIVSSYIRHGYLVKSLRCDTCAFSDSCRGIHINLARLFGLEILEPLLSSDNTNSHDRAGNLSENMQRTATDKVRAAPRLDISPWHT